MAVANVNVRGAAVNDPTQIPMTKKRDMAVINVTPDIAQQWLTFNTSNRQLTQRKVEEFKADMESGRWLDDGATVRFAHGKLLDGQHRLTALMLAGVTLPMVVVFGLEPETQITMDTGRARTPRDVLSIEGLDTWEASTLGAACHAIIAYLDGSPIYTGKKFSNQEVRAFYMENRIALDDSIQLMKGYPRRRTPIALSRALTMHFVFAMNERDKAKEFFDQLFIGDDVPRTSPVFRLRNKLMSDLIDKKARSSYEQLFMIIKAWNLFVRNTSVKTDAFMMPSSSSGFPEIL